MPRKYFGTEEISHKLREAEVGYTARVRQNNWEAANEPTTCWRDGQTAGGGPKEPERESAQVKKLVADLSLDKSILEEALSKKR